MGRREVNRRNIREKGVERTARALFLFAALVSVLAVGLICVFLFMGGVPAMLEIGWFHFLGGTKWAPTDVPAAYGILPMILGSVYITLGAVAVGVPIGILTAVFLARFCPKRFYNVLKPALSLLAGIPSVVYGFFGVTVLVPLIRQILGNRGPSILAASVLLGIMILPTLIEISTSALQAVPENYYEGAVALGATHEQATYKVVLPAAGSGVIAAITLGIGRAIGETMAVVMVAGNQARMPKGILEGIRTLTAGIIIEMGYAEGLHREALIATGVVLFCFILLINFTFAIVKRRQKA